MSSPLNLDQYNGHTLIGSRGFDSIIENGRRLSRKKRHVSSKKSISQKKNNLGKYRKDIEIYKITDVVSNITDLSIEPHKIELLLGNISKTINQYTRVVTICSIFDRLYFRFTFDDLPPDISFSYIEEIYD